MAVSDQLDRYFNRAYIFVHEIREKHPEVWNVAGETITKTIKLSTR